MKEIKIDNDFIKKYTDVISKFIWDSSPGNREDYDNLYADVIAKLMESTAKYDPERGGVPSWIRWVTRTTCFNYYRHKKTDALFGSVEYQEDMTVEENRAQDPAEREDLFTTIALVEGLTPKDREVLIDHYHYGFTYKELSDLYNENVGAVKERAHRAKQRITEQVQGELNENN